MHTFGSISEVHSKVSRLKVVDGKPSEGLRLQFVGWMDTSANITFGFLQTLGRLRIICSWCTSVNLWILREAMFLKWLFLTPLQSLNGINMILKNMVSWKLGINKINKRGYIYIYIILCVGKYHRWVCLPYIFLTTLLNNFKSSN